MMQVEEKPDVTYSDVGGCKEQIEKLREVVETPLLSVRPFVYAMGYIYLQLCSQNDSSILVSTRQRVSSSLALPVLERHSVLVQWPTGQTPPLFV